MARRISAVPRRHNIRWHAWVQTARWMITNRRWLAPNLNYDPDTAERASEAAA